PPPPQPRAQDAPAPARVLPPPPPGAPFPPQPPPPPPPPAGDDEHYIPPDPPPLPRLDPVTKGAWAALFGGPGYLLVAVLLGWVVPSWAAFCAVGAFVAGLSRLVRAGGGRAPPRF